ncbi:MAG: SDR family oxidoreductase [bacterium]|nr:SDR family oxidoreductase [bacterium]
MNKKTKIDLKNRTCLVTGGAQGIGWALARELAAAEAQVFVCDISKENISTASGSPFSGAISFHQCDVTDQDALFRWVDSVFEKTGSIDLFINNASFISPGNILDLSHNDEDKMMNVCFNGMVYGTRAALKHMKNGQQGYIVNIGSSAGRLFTGHLPAAYTAAKAAIEGYTRTLQLEVANSSITVLLVRLGNVAGTDFFKKHVKSNSLPRMADFSYLTPLSAARKIIKSIGSGKKILDIPGVLKSSYIFFDLFPRLFQSFISIGGTARKDHGTLGDEQ